MDSLESVGEFYAAGGEEVFGRDIPFFCLCGLLVVWSTTNQQLTLQPNTKTDAAAKPAGR